MPSYGGGPIDKRDVGQVENPKGQIKFWLDCNARLVVWQDESLEGLARTFRFLGTAKAKLISACFRSMFFTGKRACSIVKRRERHDLPKACIVIPTWEVTLLSPERDRSNRIFHSVGSFYLQRAPSSGSTVRQERSIAYAIR